MKKRLQEAVLCGVAFPGELMGCALQDIACSVRNRGFLDGLERLFPQRILLKRVKGRTYYTADIEKAVHAASSHTE